MSNSTQTAELAASYEYCRQLSRQAASNFYLAFRMLSGEKRKAMHALYAFLRRTDDLGDSDEPIELRRDRLGQWRESLTAALDEENPRFDDPMLPALADTVHRYEIPAEHLLAVIDGVEMDLDRSRYDRFDELAEYCRRVASAVGLACIHIWGFRGRGAIEAAEKCGLAFQLTNILRDLAEDIRRDRVYLPQQELERFGYSVDDLKRGVRDERLGRLIRFQVERAEALYQQAAELASWLEPEGRRIFGAMTATYRELLDRIKHAGVDVLDRRIRLGPWQKFRIAARWWLLPLPR